MVDQTVFTQHDDGAITVDRWAEEQTVSTTVLGMARQDGYGVTIEGRVTITVANGKAVYEIVGAGYDHLKLRLVEGTLMGWEAA